MKTRSPCLRIGRLGPPLRIGAHQVIALLRVRMAYESLPPHRLGQNTTNAVLVQHTNTRDEAMANIARAGVNPQGMLLGPSRAVNDRRALHPVGDHLTGKRDSPAVPNVIIAARSTPKRFRLDAAIVALDTAVSASLGLVGRNAEVTPKRMPNAEMLRLTCNIEKIT